MRGFLGRAGALLGRALVSFGLGSQGSGEPPAPADVLPCLELTGRASVLHRMSGEISVEHEHEGGLSIAHRHFVPRVSIEHVHSFEGC